MTQDPYGWDDWGYGGDGLGDFGSGGGFGGAGGFGGMNDLGGYGGNQYGYGQNTAASQPQKRLTPEERVKMIEDVYQDILNRKPDTRDINYYKYSTLNEDQIRKQLLSSAEHKDMLSKGREYVKLKEHSEQLETKVRMLEGQIKDQVEEFRELTNLLQEKNRHLQMMRAGVLPTNLSVYGEQTRSIDEIPRPPTNRTVEIASPVSSDRSAEELKSSPSTINRTDSDTVPASSPLPAQASNLTEEPSFKNNLPALKKQGAPTLSNQQEVFTDHSATTTPSSTHNSTSSPSTQNRMKEVLKSFVQRIV